MRIAIVNDLVVALEGLRQVVSSVEDAEVAWTALDGREAVERCRADTPDLILMDMLMPVVDGVVEGEGGVCQIALVERHRATGDVVNGFVSGFAYEGRMAIGSTVAHDSHHMIVVGTSREDMALAANRLGEAGGGVSIFRDGKEIAFVGLPIAGLMSDSPAKEVAAAADRMVAAMAECGCTLNNAYMQHSLLALVVIPELRISDLGLVDVTKFEVTELFEENT